MKGHSSEAPAESTAIIILHFGSVADTLECLSSLEAAMAESPFSLVIVDNDPRNPLDEQSVPPGVALLKTSGYLGFAAANNVGLRHVISEGFAYSLLLNNDTTVKPDFLKILLRAMHDRPHAGMVGPTMPYYYRPKEIWACGGRIWPSGRVGSLQSILRIPYAPVDYLPGACVLVRNSILPEIGLMPEKYFLGYEEAEFCGSARRQGWEILVAPEAVVYHKVGMSSEQAPKYLYNGYRSRFLFVEFLYGRFAGRILSLIIVLGAQFRERGERKLCRKAIHDHWRFDRVEREHLLEVERETTSSL